MLRCGVFWNRPRRCCRKSRHRRRASHLQGRSGPKRTVVYPECCMAVFSTAALRQMLKQASVRHGRKFGAAQSAQVQIGRCRCTGAGPNPQCAGKSTGPPAGAIPGFPDRSAPGALCACVFRGNPFSSRRRSCSILPRSWALRQNLGGSFREFRGDHGNSGQEKETRAAARVSIWCSVERINHSTAISE